MLSGTRSSWRNSSWGSTSGGILQRWKKPGNASDGAWKGSAGHQQGGQNHWPWAGAGLQCFCWHQPGGSRWGPWDHPGLCPPGRATRAGGVTRIQAPFPAPLPALTHPDPALPISSEHRQRPAGPRAAARPGERVPRTWLGWVKGLMAPTSLLGSRFSALPELLMLLCSSGKRYQKGWVTSLEALKGIK